MRKGDKPTRPANPAPLERGYRPKGGGFGYKPILKEGITRPPSNPPNQVSSGRKVIMSSGRKVK